MSFSSILTKLLNAPWQFEVFQAAYLLECATQQNSTRALPFIIKTHPNLSFPTSVIAAIEPLTSGNYQLLLNGLSLTGTQGTLPYCYTELLMQRLAHKDKAMNDFFDLFHQKNFLSHYRAYQKYRQSFTAHSTASFNLRQLLLTRCGYQAAAMASISSINPDSYCFYSGLLNQGQLSASSLVQILQSYFNLPIAIYHYPHKLRNLNSRDLSAMGKHYVQLGISTILGQRSWDCRQQFLLQIGPLDYTQFSQLLPGSQLLSNLCTFIDSLLGIELSYQLQLQLQAAAVPYCQLSRQQPLRVGLNTWLKVTDCKKDKKDTFIYSKNYI